MTIKKRQGKTKEKLWEKQELRDRSKIAKESEEF